jgi:hypothetical protein
MTTLDALQTTLAAEHAAVHVYGVLGAQASRSATPALHAAVTEAYDAHRGRRDELTRFVLDEGGTPVASEPTYELPEPLGTAERVTTAARDLELACAETYAWLVANTVGPRRRWAVQALTSTAVRVLTFRGSPEIFPGAGEYADR